MNIALRRFLNHFIQVTFVLAVAGTIGVFAQDWEGFYGGAHVGYGTGKGDTRFEPLPSAAAFINMMPTTLDVKPKGVTGGAQAGYNWVSGSFGGGFEGSISASGMKDTVTVTPIVQNNGTPFPGAGFLQASQKITWFGTLRARAGVVSNQVFVYGTGGLAFGQVKYAATSDFRPVGTTQYPASFSKTKPGWTLGGGAEVKVASNVSIKGEYLYFDFGNESRTVDPTPALPPFQVAYTWKTTAHTFNFGFNYHF